MKIIGITGTIGAGKGTLVKYLVERKDFVHFSVRQLLIEKIKQRNMPINRDSMLVIANELRANNSPSFIIEQLYKKASKRGQNCVIESIRTEGEVEALRKKENFVLFAVDAKPEIRYKRILKRNNETDNISFKEFLSNEKREMNSTDKAKQNLSKCIKMSDFLVLNNSTIKQFYNIIEEKFEQIYGH